MKKIILLLFSVALLTILYKATIAKPEILPGCAILVGIVLKYLDKAY